MTVGELIEALSRYDRNREVLTTNLMFYYRITGVQSFEPGGEVLLRMSMSMLPGETIAEVETSA